MSGGLNADRLARVDALVDRIVADRFAPGAIALVAREADVHVASAGVRDMASSARMTPDTIVRVASMTKPIIAAATMMLVEEARIALDDPVERWLPELADRRVLSSPEAPLDDTVPASRAITLRDLLTFRAGFGVIWGSCPLSREMERLGVAPGPDFIALDNDAFMAAIGALPLAHEPGERWMYHTQIDVLAVLIARITGGTLGEFLEERIFGPLGMVDSGFLVPAAKLGRLSVEYALRDGEFAVFDPASEGHYSRPQPFQSEIVSTATDYHRFATMLIEGGRGPNHRLLSRASVAMMTSDQLTAEQKARSPFPGLWEGRGWGFGGMVVAERTDPSANPGSYGWSGGFGTHFIVDPGERLFAVLLTQRMMQGPDDDRPGRDLFTLAYSAIDD